MPLGREQLPAQELRTLPSVVFEWNRMSASTQLHLQWLKRSGSSRERANCWHKRLVQTSTKMFAFVYPIGGELRAVCCQPDSERGGLHAPFRIMDARLQKQDWGSVHP